MKVLKARLYDMKVQEEQQKYASQRKSAVGTLVISFRTYSNL